MTSTGNSTKNYMNRGAGVPGARIAAAATVIAHVHDPHPVPTLAPAHDTAPALTPVLGLAPAPAPTTAAEV